MTTPKNLDECFSELQNNFPSNDINRFASEKEEDIVLYHHTVGRWIRNTWGLWQDSELKKYFNDYLELCHPDDMSGVILLSFHRHLNNKLLRLDEQIQSYKDFWNKNEIIG